MLLCATEASRPAARAAAARNRILVFMVSLLLPLSGAASRRNKNRSIHFHGSASIQERAGAAPSRGGRPAAGSVPEFPVLPARDIRIHARQEEAGPAVLEPVPATARGPPGGQVLPSR